MRKTVTDKEVIQSEFDFCDGDIVSHSEYKQCREPVQSLPYFDNPVTDNERMLNAQYAYAQGDDSALGEVYRIAMQVARKLITLHRKRNKYIAQLDSVRIEEKAHDAVMDVIRRILKGGYFDKSITGYLYLCVKEKLFHTRKIDKIIYFVDWL